MRLVLRSAVLALACAAADSVFGQGATKSDLPYREPPNHATSLDVYAPASGTNHPVLVWIHGGAWQFGDKRGVQLKPQAFNAQGFVFVSVNYRLHPEATYQDQAADVAAAIHWVRDHAREFRGSPDLIFLMGHSAGAHLAALVATDARYLKAEEMKLSALQGVVLLDGACYDIPRQLRLCPPQLRQMYRGVFSDDPAAQRDASPLTHVAKDAGIPPFLILHVANRPDSRLQSQALAAQLKSAGTFAEVVPAEGKTHATINRELGEPDDPPTRAVFDFLQQQLAD